MRVEVKPEMLRWACERAGLSAEALSARFPRLPQWLDGEAKPTLKQLEAFAQTTHAPIGYLFLPTPPVETVPIPDFRTMENVRLRRPSPDLLETIYACQERQEWYRDFARSVGESGPAFIGSARVSDPIEPTAARMRRVLGFDLAERKAGSWEDALRRFVEGADAAGVLVMVSGIVGNNTHRKLDPEEFRGFALADPVAPLVFVNGSDTKSAQMFTLAHELAHLWLGESAVSDVAVVSESSQETERWCNRVAAELLVPLAEMRAEYRPESPLRDELDRLARVFKVSTLVVLRRIYDLGALTRPELSKAYAAELARILDVAKGSGGNFYLTQSARLGKRFSRAVVTRTLEGQTLYRDAFRLLGFTKLSTFEELGHRLGVL